MNKITIPIILTVTVIIAGIFAFTPVQQASTVHSSDLITSIATTQSITNTYSTTITNTDISGEEISHWIFLESDVLYTLEEIEFTGTFTSSTSSSNYIEVNDIFAFPAEYASTEAGFREAIDEDSAQYYKIMQNCNPLVINGDEESDATTRTVSWRAIESDIGNAEGNKSSLTFGPNTKIMIELEHIDSEDSGITDASTTINYYITGASASDITITKVVNTGNEFDDCGNGNNVQE